VGPEGPRGVSKVRGAKKILFFGNSEILLRKWNKKYDRTLENGHWS